MGTNVRPQEKTTNKKLLKNMNGMVKQNRLLYPSAVFAGFGAVQFWTICEAETGLGWYVPRI